MRDSPHNSNGRSKVVHRGAKVVRRGAKVVRRGAKVVRRCAKVVRRGAKVVHKSDTRRGRARTEVVISFSSPSSLLLSSLELSDTKVYEP